MSERDAQIEALWTYEITEEKILRRLVGKGFLTQAEADDLSQALFDQLNAENIPGFQLSPLGEKMRMENIGVNLYVSLTDIAREAKTSSPSYTIQSWLRSHSTIEFLRTWERKYNPKFDESECDKLIETVHKTSTTMTPTLWANATQAMGIVSTRGKGGGTTAHPEIAEAFRAWLFPEHMLTLVKWYGLYRHEADVLVE